MADEKRGGKQVNDRSGRHRANGRAAHRQAGPRAGHQPNAGSGQKHAATAQKHAATAQEDAANRTPLPSREGSGEGRALIGEVRGLGLMLGVELVKDLQTKEPATAETAAIAEKAKDRGLLIGKGGLYSNVIRIKPPMCITKTDCDFLVDCLDECLTDGA